MASLTRRIGAWANSRSWWWTGRPGLLCFMGSQRVGHDWVTNWTELSVRMSWMSFYPFLNGKMYFLLLFFSSYYVYVSCWCSHLLFVLQAPNVSRKDVWIRVNYYKNGEYVLRIWGSIMNEHNSKTSGYGLAFCVCVERIWVSLVVTHTRWLDQV